MWSTHNPIVEQWAVFSPNEFAKSFKDNYIDNNNLSNFVNTFACEIKDNMNDDFCDVISVSEIEETVKSLKLSKAYDYICLTVEQIVNAHPAVYMVLKYLFNAILHHGVVPNEFWLSLVMSSVKNKSKSAADILNYRPFSIMPVVTKIFEKFFVSRLDPFFQFHDNQYGFVLNGGCDKALFAFHGVVSNFREGSSNLFVCTLDLVKAFKRINHFALFHLMKKKDILLYLIKIFADWFVRYVTELNGEVAFLVIFIFVQEYLREIFQEGNCLICLGM